MTKCIKGGLELKPLFVTSYPSSGEDEAKKESGVSRSSFEPVLSMLTESSSNLNTILDSPSEGFVFKLDVAEGKSSYTENKVEVTHFALKFVVISDDEQKLNYVDKEDNNSTTLASVTIPEKYFMSQANMQQEIWKQTYLTNGGEIAPSLGNIAILEGDAIITTLELVKKKHTSEKATSEKATSEEAKHPIDILIKAFNAQLDNKKFKLGILLMKSYKDIKTIFDYNTEYSKAIERNDEKFKELKKTLLDVRQNILIKLLRLLLLGYIHLDLHPGNILIDSTNNSCVIIDYGRAVSIKNQYGSYTVDNYITYVSENLRPDIGDIGEDDIKLIITHEFKRDLITNKRVAPDWYDYLEPLVRDLREANASFSELFALLVGLNNYIGKVISKKENITEETETRESVNFIERICRTLPDYIAGNTRVIIQYNTFPDKLKLTLDYFYPNIRYFNTDPKYLFTEKETYGKDFLIKLVREVKAVYEPKHKGLELKSQIVSSSSPSPSEKKTQTDVKTKFDPVLSMLTDPSSDLDLISSSSLQGFIFKLDVGEGKSSYTEYNLREKKQVEVTNFALKFVVIMPNRELLRKMGNGTIKEAETADGFLAEARIQQDIWKQTYLKQGGEIAPSIGNVTILKGTGKIAIFLKNLILKNLQKRNEQSDKSDKLPTVGYVLDYLYDIFYNNTRRGITTNPELGILLMKNYGNSKTFHTFYENYISAVKQKLQGDELKELKKTFLTIRQNILIKILRLAMVGYIHLDLHAGNILIDSTNNSCVIIDYGRAVSIKNPDGTYTMDKYITYIRTQKNDSIERILTELFGNLEALQKLLVNKEKDKISVEDKIELLEKTINSIVAVESYALLVLHKKKDPPKTKMERLMHPFEEPYSFSREDTYGGDFADRLANEIEEIQDESKIESNIPEFPSTIEAATINASVAVSRGTKRQREREEEEEIQKKPKTTLGAIKEEEVEGEIKWFGGKKTIKRKAKRITTKLKFKTKRRRISSKLKLKYNKITKHTTPQKHSKTLKKKQKK